MVAGVLALTAAPALAAECPNEQLRVENNSLKLPDCRAYELVSPADKSGGVGGVLNFEWGHQAPNPMQATSDGSGIVYSGEHFFEPQVGRLVEYASSRNIGGWGTVGVTPFGQESDNFSTIVASSANLSSYLVTTEEGAQYSSEAPEGYRDLYVASQVGSLTPLITKKPPDRTPAEFGYFDGSQAFRLVATSTSEDMSRVYFEANDALSGTGAIDGGPDENNVYRWDDGQLRLVNVLPDGVTEPNATLGFEYGDEVNLIRTPDLDHAVSTNGLRAFWTDENATPTTHLYLRESYFVGDQESERTVPIDEAVGGGGEFISASSDGAVVLFKKGERLYIYDVDTGELTDLTAAATAPQVQGVVGSGEAERYVYFVAYGVLTEAGNKRGEKAQAGADNLYVYEPTPSFPGGHEIVYIATLAASDEETPLNHVSNGGRRVTDWTPTIAQRTAEASPDGQYLAFGSHAALTGASSQGAQIFVYDASTGALACASCGSIGASDETFLPPAQDSYGTRSQRYMLDDGRLFFTTASALVSDDTNEVEDVYEWEDGEVHLISSGESDVRSVFADASESGSDVFFTTSQALVPEDQDEITDLYDAREGGGFPVPPIRANCESSAECQDAVPTPTALGIPPSATFSGAGNLLSSSPSVSVLPKGATKPLTRAEKLAKALRACSRDRARKKQRICEAAARHKYGSAKKVKVQKASYSQARDR
jgi:hypothetical protein